MRCLVTLTTGGIGELYFRFSSPFNCIVTLLKSTGNEQEEFRKQ